MRTKVQLGVLMAVMTLALLPAAAQDSQINREGEAWVQTVTGTLPAARTLRVETDLGTIRVAGADQPNIQYTVRKKVFAASEQAARRVLDQFRISAASRGETAVIEGRAESGRYKRFSLEMTVNVPRNTDVRLSTSGGGISVKQIAGRAAVETSGGSIDLDAVGGLIDAQTAGGRIRVNNAGSDVRLETAGGGITLANVKGRVVANTAGGGIDLTDAGNDVQLETAGGCITLKNVKGRIVANTAGGSIDLDSAGMDVAVESGGGSISAREVRGDMRATTAGGGIRLYKLDKGVKASTAAGPITAEFIAKRGQFTESYLQTSAGDIVVYLPPDLAVTVKAVIDTAMGHKIRSEFSEVKVSSEGGDYGPKEIVANGAINGGGPMLKIHTNLGNIELRKGTR